MAKKPEFDILSFFIIERIQSHVSASLSIKLDSWIIKTLKSSSSSVNKLFALQIMYNQQIDTKITINVKNKTRSPGYLQLLLNLMCQ